MLVDFVMVLKTIIPKLARYSDTLNLSYG